MTVPPAPNSPPPSRPHRDDVLYEFTHTIGEGTTPTRCALRRGEFTLGETGSGFEKIRGKHWDEQQAIIDAAGPGCAPAVVIGKDWETGLKAGHFLVRVTKGGRAKQQVYCVSPWGRQDCGVLDAQSGSNAGAGFLNYHTGYVVKWNEKSLVVQVNCDTICDLGKQADPAFRLKWGLLELVVEMLTCIVSPDLRGGKIRSYRWVPLVSGTTPTPKLKTNKTYEVLAVVNPERFGLTLCSDGSYERREWEPRASQGRHQSWKRRRP